MRIRVLIAVVGLGGLLSLAAIEAPAQEPKPVDPTKAALPADVVPAAFRMYMVSDTRFPPLKNDDGTAKKGADGKDVQSPKNRAGKIHCLVCEYGLNPTVAIFVRSEAGLLGADSGVAKLTRGLDGLIPKYRADKLGGFVAFLRLEGGTKVVAVKVKRADGSEGEEKVEQDLEYPDDEKRDSYAKDIRDFAGSLNAQNVPFGLAPEKSKAVTAWGIKDTDEVTVVVYYRMRMVTKPWAFAKVADLTDEKVAEILKATETAITGKK